MREQFAAFKARFTPGQWRTTLLALGPAVVVVGGTIAYLLSGGSVSTDNAYVRGGRVQISADVAGRVVEVAVKENDGVKPGTVLFRIDPRPFEIARARAEADLATAKSTILAMHARYNEIAAEILSAQADVQFAEREYERQDRLARSHVSSDAKLDLAEQERQRARQDLAAKEQEKAGILAELGGDAAIPVEAHPRYRAAEAALDQALLDLSHTTVEAPSAGIISQIDNFRPGDYVRPGEVVFALVDTEAIWVEANVKETDLTHVRAGQVAVVRIDAYPSRRWKARVESLSAGTGSEFAILPPQNATGNWVKVTQRVPVRLMLERQPDDPPLRIGMTAKVEITTRAKTAADGATLAGTPAPPSP